MNIFILDNDVETSAKYHVDKHVVKMPLEAAQMLCTTTWIDQIIGQAPRALDGEELYNVKEANDEHRDAEPADRPIPYLSAMHNHPCTIWARTSIENYAYLLSYAHFLGEEYTYRYGKVHKSIQVIESLPIPNLPDIGPTPYAQAVPEQYKNEDAVKAYRDYYVGDKYSMASWKYRDIPPWFKEASNG